MTKKIFMIGIIAMIGIGLLIFVSFYMNKIRILRSKNYVLIKYDNADGLRKNDEVRFRGIKCGFVEDIILSNDFVLVKIWLKSDILVKDSTTADIADFGILGGTKYIMLQPQGNAFYNYPEDTLAGNRKDFNIAQIGSILSDIKLIIERAIPDEGKIDAITDTIFSALNKINKMVVSNDKDIANAVNDISYSANKIKYVVDSLYPAVITIKKEVDDFSNGNGSVKRILREDTVYVRLNESLLKLNELLEQLKKNKVIKGCL